MVITKTATRSNYQSAALAGVDKSSYLKSDDHRNKSSIKLLICGGHRNIQTNDQNLITTIQITTQSNYLSVVVLEITTGIPTCVDHKIHRKIKVPSLMITKSNYLSLKRLKITQSNSPNLMAADITTQSLTSLSFSSQLQ